MSRSLSLLCCGLALALPMPAAAGDAPGTVVGPAKICFKYSSFDLIAGERASDLRAGVETMALKITSRKGSFLVGESESYMPLGSHGAPVASADGTIVYRSTGDGDVAYILYGHSDILGEGDKHILSLTGKAFNGSKADAQIYRRFRIGDPGALKCGMRYVYGWDVIVAAMGDAR